MKLSCTPISFSALFKEGRMDLEGFINFCATQELEGIDLMHTQGYTWLWKDPERELKQVGSWLNKAGLTLAAYAAGNNFAKPDTAEFDLSVAKVKHAIKEAQMLGAPLLRIFGGYVPSAREKAEYVIDYAEGFKLVLQGIELCLPLAEQCGIVLALENHGALPGHSYELERIIKHFNSPWLKCCFDCGNFIGNSMEEIEDPLRAYEKLAPHIAHVHIKDLFYHYLDEQRLAKACLSGTGLVPIRQIAASLEEHCYPGYCSLEYEVRGEMSPLEGVPLSFKYLRSIAAIQKALPPTVCYKDP